MHANKGWYLESSQEHTQVDMFFDNVTKATRTSDTAACLDRNITNPTLTHADLIGKAVGDFSNRLKGMSNTRNENLF